MLFLLQLCLGLKENLPDQELTVTQLADLTPGFFSISIKPGFGVESSFVAAILAVRFAAELTENHSLFS